MAERPLGVTLISVLGFIGAIFATLGGIAMLAFGGAASSLGALGSMLGGLGALMGIALLVVGIIAFVVNYGLWNMKKWAWVVVMIFEGLAILSSLISMKVTGIIVPGIIAVYLWKKKDIFA